MPVPLKVISNSKWPVKFERSKSISTSKESCINDTGSLKNSSAAVKGSLNIESSNDTPFVVKTPVPVVKQDPQLADIVEPTLAPPGRLVLSLL